MRNTKGLASLVLRRALIPAAQEGYFASSSSSSSSSTAAVHQRRLLQIALYNTASSSSSSSSSSRWSAYTGRCTRVISLCVAGAVSFSIAASSSSSLIPSVYAKEPPSSELIPKEVILYQYEACPFCNKVKAYLDYYDIPYKVVEVNPLSKKEIKWSEYKKVPILTVDGEHLVDSSDIIDKLGLKLHPEKSVNSVPEEENEEKKWRSWVDSHLVHVLSPNIYRNTSEALESFDYITSNDKHGGGQGIAGYREATYSGVWRKLVNKGNFSYMEKISVKYAGAAAMYFVSKKLKKKYNITDERAALYEAAETWVDALNDREFLGGSKPNLADLAVFGVLRPIRYLRAGRDMVEHTRIGDWYSRMEGVVGDSSRIKA